MSQFWTPYPSNHHLLSIHSLPVTRYSLLTNTLIYNIQRTKTTRLFPFTITIIETFFTSL